MTRMPDIVGAEFKRWFILSGLVILFLLLSGCAGTPDITALTQQQAQTVPALPTFAAAEVALGETIYAEQCASCHGVELEGEAQWKIQNEDGSFRTPPHSADGHTWHHADSILIKAIEEGGARFEGLNIGGSSNMPAFAGTLTDEEITAVLNYIKSSWPEDIQALQRQQTMQNASQ